MILYIYTLVILLSVSVLIGLHREVHLVVKPQCVAARVRPFRLKKFFASKRIVSEQRSVSHEIRLFTSSIRFPFFRFFRLFSLQNFRNYSLQTQLHRRISKL
jgi:hypothetical protein